MMEATSTPPTAVAKGSILAYNGKKVQAGKINRCCHKLRYRISLTAALGLSKTTPATPLPCEKCENLHKLDSSESNVTEDQLRALRWRTSSAASSQGAASTRAPTACGGEEDRASWSSSLGRNSSSSTSSTFGFATSDASLLRTSSSSMTTIDATHHSLGEFCCPPTQRLCSSFECDESMRHGLNKIGPHRDEGSLVPVSKGTVVHPASLIWPTQPLKSSQSSRLFAMAVSHAASFVYEE